jgi:hypothetical protein
MSANTAWMAQSIAVAARGTSADLTFCSISLTPIFDAAEGQFGRGPRRLVDEDHTGLDLPSDPLAAFDIPGDDRAAEAELGVIGQANGLILILDPKDKSPCGDVIGFGGGRRKNSSSTTPKSDAQVPRACASGARLRRPRRNAVCVAGYAEEISSRMQALR